MLGLKVSCTTSMRLSTWRHTLGSALVQMRCSRGCRGTMPLVLLYCTGHDTLCVVLTISEGDTQRWDWSAAGQLKITFCRHFSLESFYINLHFDSKLFRAPVIKRQRHNYLKKIKKPYCNRPVLASFVIFAVVISVFKAAVIIRPALTRHDVRLLLRGVVQ